MAAPEPARSTVVTPMVTELTAVKVTDAQSPATANDKPGGVREYAADEHLLSVDELAQKLGTFLNSSDPVASRGLSSTEAAARLAQYGPNVLAETKRTPEWLRFARQFKDKLLLLLLFAAALAVIAFGVDTEKIDGNTNIILAACLLAIVFLTCCLTYAQERHTESVLAQIHSLLAATSTVVRDGAEQRIDASQLVPGDVVRLALGDRVPADLRIIASSEMRTDKSGVTGESAPVKAVADADAPGTVALLARSLVFNSSLVVVGEGTGVVIKTGSNTMIGSIASLASGTSGTHETLLQIEVSRFVLFIALLAAVVAVAIFVVGISRAAAVYDNKLPKRAFLNAFINGLIIILVACVPEGLPATLTSCLAITAKRMAARHVLVKRLDIVQSLGAATVICTDKTGTLTQNRMAVEHLWYSRNVFHAASGRPALLDAMAAVAAEHREAGDLPGGEQFETPPPTQRSLVAVATEGEEAGAELTVSGNTNTFTFSGSALRERYGAPPWRCFSPHAKLLAISALCNRARPAAEALTAKAKLAAPEHAILGGAADAALYRYAELFFSVGSSRAQFPRIHDVPFNSTEKWAGVVVGDRADPSQHVVLVKGAPEVILRRCTHYVYHKAERPIDEAFREEFQHAYERFGSCGERVLGFAYAFAPVASAETYAREPQRVSACPLVFVGLISLVDPPRPGVPEAITSCRAAGIKVIMVTGDHPLTAEAIARKVGIIRRSTRHDVAAAANVPVADVALEDESVEAAVVTGEQLANLSEPQWRALLLKPEIVLARTSPQQKLTLVEHLQAQNEVVAVTGDGVNDSPALKRAQIGVAMGSTSASDVAREAADIVLLDDNFASIVAAIEEGRTLFENLKKTIAYTLAHAPPEILPALLNLAFGFPLALNGLIILTIDLLTEQGPAISLAFERAEHAVMLHKPRNLKTERLVTPHSLFYSYVTCGCAIAATCMFAYFLAFTSRGVSVSELAFSTDDSSYWSAPPQQGSSFTGVRLDAARLATDADYARVIAPHRLPPAAWSIAHDGQVVFPPLWVTQNAEHVYDAPEQWRINRESQSAYYITLIMCQFWHIWNCRTRSESIFVHGLFSNIVTVWGVLAELAIAVFIVYLPAFHAAEAFQTASLRALLWTPHFAFALYIFAYNETVKWAARRRPEGWVATWLQW